MGQLACDNPTAWFGLAEHSCVHSLALDMLQDCPALAECRGERKTF